MTRVTYLSTGLSLLIHTFSVVGDARGTEPTSSGTPLSHTLTCSQFTSWVAQTKAAAPTDPKIKTSSEFLLISDQGYHPRWMKSYKLLLTGRLRWQASGKRAEFSLEAVPQGGSASERRTYSGPEVSTLGSIKKRESIELGKKVLVWAGARGPTEAFTKEFLHWVDFVPVSAANVLTTVPVSQGPVSEQGTVFYYPEGVLEVFTRRSPLLGGGVPTREPYRLYLWGEGCSDQLFPAPWPR